MKGLTLIELMVTMSVIALLIAFGLPRLQGMSHGNRLVTQINRLSSDIAFTRNEAANRNVPVSVVSNNNANWADGWTVRLIPDDENTVIRTSGGLDTNFLFTGSTNGTITFNPDGTKLSSTTETIKLCKNNDTTPHGKQIEIISTGRYRLTTGETCP